MKIKITAIVLVSLVFVIMIWLKVNIFTSPDIDYAKQTEWAHEKGRRVNEGDFLSFNEDDIRNDTPESKIYGCTKTAYPNGYELFILRQVIEMDDEEYEHYNIDRTFYLVFKDKQLVENYNSESTKNTLDTQISSNGGYFLSQSYMGKS